MRRRQLITLLGGAAAAWPFAARAQQPQKMPRIGTLMPSPVEVSTSLDAFLQGLRDLGYIEGQNIAIERRFADWKLDRLPELAADLVRRNVDVIVAVSTPPGRAAQQATRTIPIVVGGMADPVGDGLVEGLARPNGNVTGTTFIGPELIAKRLGLLREAIPSAARVAVLWHPGVYSEYTMAQMLHETEAAARTLGLELQLLAAQGPGDFDEAFAAMRRDSADALLLFPEPDALFGAQAHRGYRQEQSTARDLRREGVRGRRWVDVLRGELACVVPADCDLRGQDIQGRQARGFARGAADQVRIRGQPADRQGAGSRHSADAARPRRRGD
jgi:ABC-type sugar transport system substrate-binding protein